MTDEVVFPSRSARRDQAAREPMSWPRNGVGASRLFFPSGGGCRLRQVREKGRIRAKAGSMTRNGRSPSSPPVCALGGLPPLGEAQARWLAMTRGRAASQSSRPQARRKFNPFFAGACTSQKTLLAERVCELASARAECVLLLSKAQPLKAVSPPRPTAGRISRPCASRGAACGASPRPAPG